MPTSWRRTRPRENGSDGFGLFKSRGNTLERNTAEGNDGDGFLLQNTSNGNVLERNRARGNGGRGFDLKIGSRDNDLVRNEAEENGGDGFAAVGTSSGNRFSENEAEDNAGFDCRDTTAGGTGDFGTDNVWTGNEGDTSSPAGLCGDDDDD